GAAPEAAETPGRTPGWLRMHGSLIVDGSAQSVSGAGAELRRQEDVLPRMWFNAGGYLRPGWRYTTRVHMSGYESADRQAVNRYRVDLRTPMLDAAVGDVNPILHDLILSGRRVRGLQADVRAGPARLTVVSGQSNRPVTGLLDAADPTRVDRPGTYGQNLLAVRPAIGSGHRFQAGLSLLKVRDDVASISPLRTEVDGGTGGTRSVNPTPKDNLVLGADLTLRLFGGRALVRYESAASLLANDISGGALTEAGLDSIMADAGQDPLGIDPSAFERLLILNGSLIPLDPRGMTNLAHQVRTSFRAGSHMLSVEFRSVGGSYHTLGYPSLQRDRRGVRVRDSFTLFQDALAVYVGFEQDRDNLDAIKPATTTSRGTFATVSWQPSALSPGVSASLRLGTRNNPLAPAEIGARDEQNRIITLGATLPVPLTDRLRTRLLGNVSLIDREDAANPAVDARERYYLGGVQAETPTRSTEGSLMVGLNRSELPGLDAEVTDFHRATAYLRHAFTQRWSGILDGTLTGARGGAIEGVAGLDYDRTELLAGGEFAWTPQAVLSFSAGVATYSDALAADRDTRELLARLRMSRSF
ncbi:MAG TPA: hypothetical protein VMK65_00635, partial [Longimicrobiales bacterium]|nr:hypothetical protein [Longimicrobiales bacterium]